SDFSNGQTQSQRLHWPAPRQADARRGCLSAGDGRKRFPSRNSVNIDLNRHPFLKESNYSGINWPGPYSSFERLSRRLLVTTDTELSAMAAPAIIGSNRKPLKGYSSPAAMGIPIRL